MSNNSGSEKASYYAGLFLMLSFNGTNVSIKTYQIFLYFIIFFFFVGNPNDYYNIMPILTHLFCFFGLIFKIYQEERHIRILFFEKWISMRFNDVKE